MSSEEPDPVQFEEEVFVDVRRLPLNPPQPAPPAERATRRPWHPVMWDSSVSATPPPPPQQQDTDESAPRPAHEYEHKQRIRNLRRLIADGKVKPTPETLIFFLCNKFAVSEERQNKIGL